ncbi:hypothetical protein A3D42_00815 [Candidatus Nomurabacteria bacterium RIFCSPHIGHO2_02_FULL_41_18]|uniref:Uncharacterized protein n=1 Tax=Candidatus Nomurabacteria bacterium RIFCSPHIGHO2_02_FULL_41_18 TaxID=1801754 RepID=A0A1F6W539_9BACT|nr:MAG: hypothetical protein A2737_00985 [Candidatus Nomurabacteria bacterium RIFCSPHIGHO2_01_FULL_41_71]OGI77047.1 MAG: hypothetical protein A3D42_00815 [Candidatus Nomurabacteria bacterium RIFCSPHIGHO2_02_FULL_41_18]OGI90149.1 MAG: hypothetical protein A3B01_02510 [Candidatus Nomurabacteria bacterium RIFCSPLOWO2_01_FULL_41_52b]
MSEAGPGAQKDQKSEAFLTHWFLTIVTPLRLDYYRDRKAWEESISDIYKSQIKRITDRMQELLNGLQNGEFPVADPINPNNVIILISHIKLLPKEKPTPEDIQSLQDKFNELFPKRRGLL